MGRRRLGTHITTRSAEVHHQLGRVFQACSGFPGLEARRVKLEGKTGYSLMGLRNMNPFPLPTLSENFPSGAPDYTALQVGHASLACPREAGPLRSSQPEAPIWCRLPCEMRPASPTMGETRSAQNGWHRITQGLRISVFVHQGSGSSQPSVASWRPLPSQPPCPRSPHLLWPCSGHLSSSLDPPADPPL